LDVGHAGRAFFGGNGMVSWNHTTFYFRPSFGTSLGRDERATARVKQFGIEMTTEREKKKIMSLFLYKELS
jgi:hypothetical protein